MAKTLIHNVIAGQKYGFILPCDKNTANTFCTAALEGTFNVFEKTSESGNEVETGVIEYRITVQQEDTGAKETFAFNAKNGKNEGDIKTALLGKTFNGVKADKIYIIGARVLN